MKYKNCLDDSSSYQLVSEEQLSGVLFKRECVVFDFETVHTNARKVLYENSRVSFSCLFFACANVRVVSVCECECVTS